MKISPAITSPAVLGFGLIELVVTLAVIALLVSIAIPTYEFAMVRARLVSAQGCLTEHAQYMERYRTARMSYFKDGDAPKSPACEEISPEHYQLYFQASGNSFLIRATPQGRQADAEIRCGIMSIDHFGRRTPGNSDCW